jgi:hypothetical protein
LTIALGCIGDRIEGKTRPLSAVATPWTKADRGVVAALTLDEESGFVSKAAALVVERLRVLDRRDDRGDSAPASRVLVVAADAVAHAIELDLEAISPRISNTSVVVGAHDPKLRAGASM